MPREATPKEKRNQINTMVIVVYEGHRTEREYFVQFEKQHHDCKFKFNNIDKKSFDKHNTIKGELVQIVKGESIFMATGKHTPYHFCTMILDKYSELIGLDADLEIMSEKEKRLVESIMDESQRSECACSNTVFYIDDFLEIIIRLLPSSNSEFNYKKLITKIKALKKYKRLPPSDIIKKALKEYSTILKENEDAFSDENNARCDRLIKIRNDSIEEANDSIVKDGIVINNEKMLALILSKIKSDNEYKREYDYELSNPDLWDETNKEPINGDRTFVVFDRDYDSRRPDRSDDYYREVFRQCEMLGYEVLLSTPDFEMWLLLHHEDVDPSYVGYKDRRKLNDRIMHLEKIKEKEIKKIDDERFHKYYSDTFEIAVERSKKYPLDLEQLLKRIGTNVGIKLKSLL